MEDLINNFELTEEDIKLTKALYEEYLEKKSEEESILNLESFTYAIYELGLLSYELKINLEKLLLLKKELGLDFHEEKFVMNYLNLPEIKEKDIEDN